jgi:hypothetical protein
MVVKGSLPAVSQMSMVSVVGGVSAICTTRATDAHADGAQVGVAEAAFGKAANETGLADGKVSYQANFRAIVHR